MFKFLHAADIHLDSPRAGLPDSAPLDEIRQAPRKALKNLVQLAIDEGVAFVLIAGDLYDGDWRDFRTGLFFIEQMARLKEAGIPVFLIRGNHDALNKMTRTLHLPDNVRLLDAARPQTVRLDELEVAIHGQSFPRPDVTDNLAQDYPPALKGLFNIGLLHTCATKTGEHEAYAPCSLDDLLSKNYDYWALGHIHKREILCCDPYVVFPGNIQGRHIKETGPKGCYLVEVNGGRVQVKFRPLDVFRWELCVIDVDDLATPDAILQRVGQALNELVQASDGLPLAVRMELSGPTAAHARLAADPRRWEHEIVALALQQGEGRVWIERVIRDTSPPLENATAVEGTLQELSEYVSEVQEDPAALAALAAEFQSLRDKLSADLNDEPLPITDPSYLRRALDDVRHRLAHYLQAPGTTP